MFGAEGSFSQIVQGSFEAAPPTHLTSSQEDSQFAYQGLVEARLAMTRPRFSLNRDFPPDMLYEPPKTTQHRKMPTTLTCLKESSCGPGQIGNTLLTSINNVQGEGTITSVNRSRVDPNSLRKRVFSNGGGNSTTLTKRLSPIYDRFSGAGGIYSGLTSPMHVQSLDKSDIAEMEGKDFSKIRNIVNLGS